MANKYVCIHGHFYQPPRESPWLEDIEQQDSAAPYHDWNERITAECYWPNAQARIINQGGDTEQSVNNYEKISFNFGPTLLRWLKLKHPALLQRIIEADQKSCHRFNGHGNAMAQAYHHLIMPLANQRDKLTEICWGIADFKYYFQRQPEGLWLPETAVDLETLDLMQQQGIKFTILSPRQAKKIRHLKSDTWSDQLELGIPYLQRLPSGQSMVILFYDGQVSQAVAFEHLLVDGGSFAERLMIQDSATHHDHYLVNIATDGETYGHHHAFGDMSLAFAIQCLENSQRVQLTNYAAFIELYPPEFEVDIIPYSSWSCEHGVARWQSNCGCHQNAGWHQQWRAPLREALDGLRDQLANLYEQEMSQWFDDPWLVRNHYIQVIHEPYSINRFLKQQASRTLNHAEKIQVVKWLEMQHYALLMYTSCGWFFDDISGLETVQILRYAGRAIELAQQLTGDQFEADFLRKLALAASNLPEFEHGERVYQRFVKPYLVK